MKRTPAVSVVVATRNYGRFLAARSKSILEQTWTDLEIVVIDDGSTDDTHQVIQPFLANSRIRCHRTDGLGQARAKNLGIQLSRAPLIAFLDGDDEWLQCKLERQLPLFRDPAIGVVYCPRTLMDDVGRELPTPASPLVRGVTTTSCSCGIRSASHRRSCGEPCSKPSACSTRMLTLAIDYDLWLRVARHFEFDYVDEPVVRYRTGHANLSSRISRTNRNGVGDTARSPIRRGNAIDANAAAVVEAWGSTCRTMAFVERQRPLKGGRRYTRAASHDGRWLASAKGIAGILFRWLAGIRR